MTDLASNEASDIEIDPIYDPDIDAHIETTKAGETLLGYGPGDNVTAIIHRLGDIKTLEPGDIFEVCIEQMDGDFVVYANSLIVADDEGSREMFDLWDFKVSREDLTKLVSSPPLPLPPV